MTSLTSMIDKPDIPTIDELKQLELTMKELGSDAVPSFNFDISEVNSLPPAVVTQRVKLR